MTMLDSKGFDLWADGYDKAVGLSDEANSYPFAGYRRVLGRIFEIVTETGKPKGFPAGLPAVLDIGFGTAALSAELYERGFSIYGQDFSERMTALASAKMPGAKLFTGDFSNGLCAQLTIERYDFIIATYSLHHLDDGRKIAFLRELLGLLNEGGSILIGDVAFETRAELEVCKASAGEEWDDDEFYFVAEEMKKAFPNMEFEKTSFCAGVITLKKEC